MGDVVYISRIRVERIKGPLRRAELPGADEPVYFGVHDEVADHYGVQRAFDRHMPYCPVYRSVGAAIEITTALELVAG